MRILLVGSDYIWSIERLYRKYLAAQGDVDVSLFAAQNQFYSWYERSTLHKAFFRFGYPGIYRKINDSLLREVEAFAPDVIWVFKGMEVLPSTLALLRREGIRLVNFNGDNPFIFSGRGSGNSNVVDSLPLYDLHFTYNLEVKSRLEKEYGLRTAFLPFGFEIPDELFGECRMQPEIGKLCFVGNPDSHRAAFILELAGAGVPVDVYGNSWNRHLSHPAITIFPAAEGKEFWKVLRRYRIQLNLMRPHNEDSHNMRTFEIPGVGGIMLAPGTTEHRMFFKEDEEAFLFRDLADCVKKAKQILAFSDEEAEQIRIKARQRSLKDRYRYQDRAAEVSEHLRSLYAKAGHRTL